jgi:hypothetical protein
MKRQQLIAATVLLLLSCTEGSGEDDGARPTGPDAGTVSDAGQTRARIPLAPAPGWRPDWPLAVRAFHRDAADEFSVALTGTERFRFRRGGISLEVGDSSSELLSAARFPRSGPPSDISLTAISDDRAEWVHAPGLREIVEIVPEGLEQTWILDRRHGSSSEIRVEMELGSQVELVDATAAQLTFAVDGITLRYGSVRAHDAGGRELVASLESDGTTVSVVVDGRGAEYPVTIDPLIVVGGQALAPQSGWDARPQTFGSGVAVHGGVVAIGEPGREHSSAQPGGFVHLYNQQTDGSWSACNGIAMPSSLIAAGANFGTAVALEDNLLVVGAPGPGTPVLGAIWIVDLLGVYEDYFTTPACEHTAPSIYQRIKAPSGAVEFGRSVAISGNRIVVGSAGEVVWTYAFNGSSWALEHTFPSPSPTSDLFGRSVAIDRDNPDRIAVSAEGGDAVYVYEYSGSWDSGTRIDAPTGHSYFGQAVALSDESVWTTSVADAYGGGESSWLHRYELSGVLGRS